MAQQKGLCKKDSLQLLQTLQTRFLENQSRHSTISWEDVVVRLGKAHPKQLYALYQMEQTGGEPDVILQDSETGEFLFFDCAPESPAGRRSLCYDQAAMDARKTNKPQDSAMNMAASMGISLLNETQYRLLQQLGKFDQKTSSWILTPNEIRALGGALFCDRRYEQVFLYHNGADSYYAARGFRGFLRV